MNPTEVNNLARAGRSTGSSACDRVSAAAVPGAVPAGVPGVPAARGVREHEPGAHLKAHATLYDNLISGNDIAANTTKAFYDDYFAVLDLPAEFYLETVQYVFQEYRLARGTLEFRGRRVDPAAIRRTGCSGWKATATTSAVSARPLPPRPVHGAAAPAPEPSSAARRRALRGVQRVALGAADLPGRAAHDPRHRLIRLIRAREVARDGWPCPRSTSAGSSCAHWSTVFQQRVRKRQPEGGSCAFGSSPVSTMRRRSRSPAGSGSGTAESSACVYGWAR